MTPDLQDYLRLVMVMVVELVQELDELGELDKYVTFLNIWI